MLNNDVLVDIIVCELFSQMLIVIKDGVLQIIGKYMGRKVIMLIVTISEFSTTKLL